jgi:hypothetical protein
MLRIIRTLRFVFAGLLVATNGIAGENDPSRVFIQRIEITDFLLLETNNDLALSPGSTVVLCFAGGGDPAKVERAVALRRRADGSWWLSYMGAAPSNGSGQYERKQRELAPEIARNVVAIFGRLMQDFAAPPVGALYHPSGNEDAWIYLRTDMGQTAGVAMNGALHLDRGADSAIYRDLCAGLVGVFVVPPEEQDRVLTQLDRLSAAYAARHGLIRR